MSSESSVVKDSDLPIRGDIARKIEAAKAGGLNDAKELLDLVNRAS